MLQDFLSLEGKLVFVMGGGKFGARALKYLTAKEAKVLLVDVNPDCLASSDADIFAVDLSVVDSLADGQSAFLVGDAIDYLLFLLETQVPDLVVTAVPGNVIARAVEIWLSNRGCTLRPYSRAVSSVLENIPKSLVSFVDEDSAFVLVSYMPSNMRCRDDCMPPRNFCALTGRPRLASMKRLLDFSVYNHTDVLHIFTSWQLTGGLGAISGKELDFLLKQLGIIKKPFTLAIGTACDCHGVLNLLEVE